MKKPNIPGYVAVLVLTHLILFMGTVFGAPVEFYMNSAYRADGMPNAMNINGHESAEAEITALAAMQN